eukprot:m.117200 g.117200  ORF g.117200 m.117200 type:complete len:370 (+) comp9202_c0_seq12:34-1143(+)
MAVAAGGRLRVFLERAATQFPAWRERAVVVLGNESADLDSIACALVHSHVLQQLSKDPACPIFPVVNAPRADMKLRTEALGALAAAGIDWSALLYVDDALGRMRELQKENKLSIVLVDHNQLAVSQADIATAVTAIVDHHKDTQSLPHARSWITDAGSCASMVARHAQDNGVPLEPAEALLLSYAIAADTGALSEYMGRARELDHAMAAALGALHGRSMEDLMADVMKWRQALGALSCAELLRKDYKKFVFPRPAGDVVVGMPSSSAPVAAMAAMPDFAESIDALCVQQGLGAVILMSLAGEPPARQMGVRVCDPRIDEARVLELLQASELGLVPLGVYAGVHVFDQQSIKHSRKVPSRTCAPSRWLRA